MDLQQWAGQNKITYTNGQLRRGGSVLRNQKNVYHEWADGITGDEVVLNFNKFMEELEKMDGVKDEGEHVPIFPTVEWPEDFVKQAISYNKITVCPKGEKIKQGRDSLSREDLENKVINHLTHYRKDSKFKGKPIRECWSTSEIRVAMNVYLKDLELNTRTDLREGLPYREGYAQYTHDALTSFMKKFGVADVELSVQVLKQWMWQVKRYLYGEQVYDPLFVNILGQEGTQGAGKSLFVASLTKYFRDFTQKGSIEEVLDSRNLEKWALNYIVFFDELVMGKLAPHAIGQAVAALKTILTSDTVTGRQMRTTKQMSMDKTFSAIATSNYSIVSVINDPTGMRRFYELEITTSRAASVIADLEKLGTVSQKMWWGIDHSLPRGYVHHANEWGIKLAAVQSTYKKEDNTTLALEHIEQNQLPALKADHPALCAALNKECPPIEGFTWVAAHKFRKIVTDWIGDNISKKDASMVVQGTRFLQVISNCGYITGKTLNGRACNMVLFSSDNAKEVEDAV